MMVHNCDVEIMVNNWDSNNWFGTVTSMIVIIGIDMLNNSDTNSEP